ncbi:hypothetical protein H5410_032828 [Solanum commersonii]|uniref:Uncharacterized protein n=1 Tax=Solanum commersonii TaxID=4109 RepID=A0A9J5YLZ9_SOLCO|nr:hypothetical protein H5410_032828 [Solanum commersonii]
MHENVSPTAMFTKRNTGSTSRHKKPFNPNAYCDHCHMKGHLKVDYFKLMKCDHCHNTGHLKSNCYQLIGYPADYKGKRTSYKSDQLPVQQSSVKTQDLFCYDELIAQNSLGVQSQLQLESSLVQPVPAIAEETNDSTHTTSPVLPSENIVLPMRHSTRNSRPLIWHKDYVTRAGSSKCLYSIASGVNYAGLSAKYQSFISKLSAKVEPNTYAEEVGDLRFGVIINHKIFSQIM